MQNLQKSCENYILTENRIYNHVSLRIYFINTEKQLDNVKYLYHMSTIYDESRSFNIKYLSVTYHSRRFKKINVVS